jgi:hypothetical protein
MPMWLGTKTERNICPDEFQQRIADAGGLNRYDEPNFRLVWGQTETFRAGGEWTGSGQIPYRGYRDLLIGMGDPCWILQQWQAPEKYGTPESYYVFNYDEETNLQTLGEYPYAGRYETVLPLVWKGMINGRLAVEHMRLSSLLIDLLVPILDESSQLTAARKRALMLKYKEDQDREQLNQIEAGLADAFPAFGTAARSSAYLECNSVVQKKAESIERYWRQAVATIKARGKGLSVGE